MPFSADYAKRKVVNTSFETKPNMIRRFIVLAVLVALLPAWLSPTYAQSTDWVDVRAAGDFRVRANFSLDAFPQLLPELTRLERDLTAQLQLPSRGEPVHLLLFADRQAYTLYVNRYFIGAPTRRALFIKGSQPGWVMAYVNDQFEVDVRHESTHALLHSRLAMVPLWLDEGLAEYYEVKAERRKAKNPHQSAVTWAARIRRAPDLQKLESLHNVRDMGKAEYRAAWAWVHFMLHGPPEARAVLVQYLSDIAKNQPPGRLSDRLNQAVPNLKKAFLKHHR